MTRQAFARAAVLQRDGKLAEAATLYEEILRLNPSHVDALHNLGIIRIQQGRAEPECGRPSARAARHCSPQSRERRRSIPRQGVAMLQPDSHAARRAILAQATIAAAHKVALAALGRPGQAEAHYAQAIALRADYVDALRNLGKALLTRNRPRLALPHLSHALELKPGADAHNDLGNALAMLDRHQEAIEQYRQALAKNASFPAAYNNLGNTLATLGRHAEAVAELRKALALTPDYPEALSNLGNTLLSLHQLDEAVQCFERALALRPDMAQAYAGRGGALQTLGQIEQSREAIERAIVHAPGNASYYHALCAVKRFAPGDPHLVAMQALACGIDTLRPSERVALHFALGKAYADIGEHERAFHHYADGNALHRAGIIYDEAFTLAGFDRLKKVFTSDFIRSRDGGGEPSDAPIFIVGMPRSGTTLVEQILASHGQVFAAGELQDMSRLVASIRRADGAHGFPELVPAMTEAQLRAFGASYLAGLRKLAPAAARITDKMMGNFYFAGLIRLALPNARIIHVIRDPLDTCLSLFTHLFAGELIWTNDLGEIGRYYRAYASLMDHWRAVLPPGAMLDVQYEGLVADLEPQARRLIAYCGLDWNDRCLSFHTTERPVWTASVAQVRQPIYRSAIGRWRSYEPWLGPLLDALDSP